MSLKAFHIVFITASILLAITFAAWSVLDFIEYRRLLDLVFAAGASISAVLLIVYSKYFLKKLKHISYL